MHTGQAGSGVPADIVQHFMLPSKQRRSASTAACIQIYCNCVSSGTDRAGSLQLHRASNEQQGCRDSAATTESDKGQKRRTPRVTLGAIDVILRKLHSQPGKSKRTLPFMLATKLGSRSNRTGSVDGRSHSPFSSPECPGTCIPQTLCSTHRTMHHRPAPPVLIPVVHRAMHRLRRRTTSHSFFAAAARAWALLARGSSYKPALLRTGTAGHSRATSLFKETVPKYAQCTQPQTSRQRQLIALHRLSTI